MMNRMVRLILVITLLMTVNSTNVSTLAQSEKALPSPSSFFTENKGQWDPEILFVRNTSFGKVAFTKDAVYYQMVKSVEKSYETQLVKLSFVNPQLPKVQGIGLLSHYNNYFIGNDSSKWASYCRNFEKIEYLDVWTGIDLAYFFTPEGLKYEYYVDPQVNIQDLQIKVEGAELDLMGGSLQISTDLGNIQDANLKVFDQSTKKEINSNFAIQNDIYSFTGIPEERQNTVVIDPLVFSTYLGGSDTDNILGITADEAGDSYVCGFTFSSDFPISTNPIQKITKERHEVFITKLNKTGTNIIFSTYLGGSNEDVAHGIRLGKDGNIYIGGYTASTNFPTSLNIIQRKLKSECDVFVAKINHTGSKILYSTLLGGVKDDFATGIVLDNEGNAYICGTTGSEDFPISPEAFQKNLKGDGDIFISKINNLGSQIIYSTYLGGESGADRVNGMVLDNENNIYVCGEAGSEEYPITKDAIQPVPKGFWDGFITKLNNTGSDILYSTFFGGSNNDDLTGIALDAMNNIYICGKAESPDFVITPEAFQKKLNGEGDAFIGKLNSTGTTILSSTYLGGSGLDFPTGITLDIKGNPIICGITESQNFPIRPGNIQPTRKGKSDIFITKLDSTCSHVLYSTYCGGATNDLDYSEAETPTGIVIDSSGLVYICGSTFVSDFPTTPGAYQTKNNGDADGFIVKFDFGVGNTPPDTTPPILEIISPVENVTTIDDQIMIKCKVYDNESGIESYDMNGTKDNEIKAWEKDERIFAFLFPLEIGVNKIIINATNGAMLTSTKTLKVTRIDPDLTFIELWVDKPQAFIDGKPYVIDVPPMVRAGRTQVPLRFIAEGLKAAVTYEAKTQKIVINLKSTTITLQIYNQEILIERIDSESKTSEKIMLEMAPYVYNGRTMVPIRFIAEAFGAKVDWEPSDRKITISMKR